MIDFKQLDMVYSAVLIKMAMIDALVGKQPELESVESTDAQDNL